MKRSCDSRGHGFGGYSRIGLIATFKSAIDGRGVFSEAGLGLAPNSNTLFINEFGAISARNQAFGRGKDFPKVAHPFVQISMHQSYLH